MDRKESSKLRQWQNRQDLGKRSIGEKILTFLLLHAAFPVLPVIIIMKMTMMMLILAIAMLMTIMTTTRSIIKKIQKSKIIQNFVV